MARPPASNDAFFREVDDEVRRERMAQAARRYGIGVGVLILVLLIGFGGWLYWQHRRDAIAGERGERMAKAMTALVAGNAAGARKDLDALAATDSKGYAPLARVLLADSAVQAGKTADAAKAFAAVANDGGVPQPIRDLALVRGTAIAFDTLPPDQVIARLKPLAVAGNPYFGSAGEMIGIAEMKRGRSREAGRMFAAVARDRKVPSTIRERVGQLAAELGVEVVQPADSPRP